MKDSARYRQTRRMVGRRWLLRGLGTPGIIGPCCHGDDEASVYAELTDRGRVD